MRESDNLRAFGLTHNLADLVIAVKRDLGHPVYAHELLAHPTVAGLTDLLLHLDTPGARVEITTSTAVAPDPRPDTPSAKNPRAAFLLSSARAGSILRVMLAGHPPSSSLLQSFTCSCSLDARARSGFSPRSISARGCPAP